jgi:DNA-binding CsgD family transcriptional regulator/tetratricopeptide (TPR) repeat protein
MPDTVVGREREVDAAAQLLSDLEGGARALVFEGEPGIGKTTVLAVAVGRAPDDCLVLSARPTKAESQLAFAALSDLLQPVVDRVQPDLPDPQRHAIAVALLREEPDPSGLDQRAVCAAALSIVQALAEKGPVLIAIDDLQWLDPSSARVLEFVVRRIEALPVGIVACERIGDPRGVPLELERTLPAGRCGRIRLQPLSLAALQRILKQSLGREFTRRTLVRIERAAGGNPFFALELARVLPEDASTAAALPFPDSLRGLVQERIAGLPKRCRQLLLAAAALAVPTVEIVLSAVAGSPADAVAALDRALESGVIGVDGSLVQFAHPLFAEGVYSSAQVAERRTVHRRLSELVDGVEERARHLALAASGQPDAGLADILDEGAEHARRRGAPDVAAELAEQAWLLTPPEDTEERLRRTTNAAAYHYHAGELQRAREMVETVLGEAPSGGARARALRLLGEIHYHEDSFQEATQLFEEALDHVGDDAEARSEVELRLTYGLNVMGDFPAILEHAHRALELAERAGNSALLGEALAVVAVADCMLGHGIDEEKVERALALEDPNRQVPVAFRPSLIAGCLAIYAGRLERSEGILSRLRERLLARGEESDLPFVLCQLAWAACWRGDLRAADAYAEEGVDTATRIQGDSMRCIALAFAAVSAAYAGDPEQTKLHAHECRVLAPRTSLRIAVLWAGWAEALLALSLDDPQAADAALGPLAAPFEHEEVPDPARVFFLPDEIEALIGLGRLDRAERLLANFEAAASRLRRRWALMLAARCRAILLAAGGDLEAASHAAGEALALCEGLELRIEEARTLLVAGQLERRRRKKRAASDHLQKALAEFQEMGAQLWAERARGELQRVGLRPSAPDDLTASERRVAELAASGLKNREVAAQLYLSPKTVEATLARVYRKLEIHSRAELGARLGSRGVDPAQM